MYDADHALTNMIREFNITMYYPDITAGSGNTYALFELSKWEDDNHWIGNKFVYILDNGTDLEKWFNNLDILDLREMWSRPDGSKIIPQYDEEVKCKRTSNIHAGTVNISKLVEINHGLNYATEEKQRVEQKN